ncbi:MAG: hypothetical protein ACK4N5_13370 [Myxococcales bacterium]
MRRLPILLALALALVHCGDGGVRLYDNNDLELATAYTAKEVCSCLFVMEMGEDYCRAWTKANPNVASFTADTKEKRVRTGALLFWGASARFHGPDFGCVLE